MKRDDGAGEAKRPSPGSPYPDEGRDGDERATDAERFRSRVVVIRRRVRAEGASSSSLVESTRKP